MKYILLYIFVKKGALPTAVTPAITAFFPRERGLPASSDPPPVYSKSPRFTQSFRGLLYPRFLTQLSLRCSFGEVREDSTFQLTSFPNLHSGATARLLNRLGLAGTTSKSLTMATRTLFGSRFQNAWIALPGRVEPFNSAAYVVVASSSFPDREA